MELEAQIKQLQEKLEERKSWEALLEHITQHLENNDHAHILLPSVTQHIQNEIQKFEPPKPKPKPPVEEAPKAPVDTPKLIGPNDRVQVVDADNVGHEGIVLEVGTNNTAKVEFPVIGIHIVPLDNVTKL